MLREFLTEKYGAYVTDHLLTNDNEPRLDKIDKDSLEGQEAVTNHLRSLRDDAGNRLVPDEYLKVDWGMDFSSWLGPFNGKHDVMLIGAEPHIANNYQLVYDFGLRGDEDVRGAALRYEANNNDIWHYIAKNFASDNSLENKAEFIERCYITDLCHIVPKECGQVDSICAKLGIPGKEWEEFRAKVARQFLVREVEVVKPKLIVLHGGASRDFFQGTLGVEFSSWEKIAGWRGSVSKGTFSGATVLGIPHLKGQVLNELWRSKSDERVNSVRQIIQDFLKPGVEEGA